MFILISSCVCLVTIDGVWEVLGLEDVCSSCVHLFI